jgi:2,3-bisphosphoglycerate-independent phosphoglycerate mutase
VGKVATIAGRFYAMDRGGHWGQTLMTYKAMVSGVGQTAHSTTECVNNSYRSQIFDEMILPTVILNDAGSPVGKISDSDAVIFFNFRSDRAVQLTQMFVKPESVPEQFRQKSLQNLFFVTMTEYEQGLVKHIAFTPVDLKNNLAEVISQNAMEQFHIAESEKYAHVTAFFNCGRSEKFPGEDRLIVTSPENNSRNYVDHPEMSAEKLTQELTQKILNTKTNFFVANFANTDIVGHTGDLEASILAVEFLDKCLKKIYDACEKEGAVLIVTADHGNCEQMINAKSGDIDKDHTTNPVPFLLAAQEFKFIKPFDRKFEYLSTRVPAGVICDIAPTILELFGLPKPIEMTGISLLEVIDEVPHR